MRIGLNTGTAVEPGGDCLGPVLNRCARITILVYAGHAFPARATASCSTALNGSTSTGTGSRGVEAPHPLFGLRRADGDPLGVPAAGDAISTSKRI